MTVTTSVIPSNTTEMATQGITITPPTAATRQPAIAPSNASENISSTGLIKNHQAHNNIVLNNVVPSQRSNLVYVLGTLGYDFGTEARRDTFKQLMPTITIDNIELPSNPYDARQMVDYLESNLSETKSLIWTVNLELTPIYAIKPVGAFAAEIYQVMQYMLGSSGIVMQIINLK